MTLYAGSCQCGAVAFEADLDLSKPVVTCNCARCRRLGSRLAFTPRAGFTLLRGEDALSEYLFNRHAIHHLFCRTCGIEGFAFADMPDGTAMAAVNVNCLDGVDPFTLETSFHDGASA